MQKLRTPFRSGSLDHWPLAGRRGSKLGLLPIKRRLLTKICYEKIATKDGESALPSVRPGSTLCVVQTCALLVHTWCWRSGGGRVVEFLISVDLAHCRSSAT